MLIQPIHFSTLDEEVKAVAMMKTSDGLYELSSSSGEEEIDEDLESTLDRLVLSLQM